MKPSLSSQILHQIAQIQRMEPGKLCIIGQGSQGPYYNLQCRENGKPVSRYVPKEQVETVALHTANYQKFQVLVAEYARLIIEQTRAERMSGSKKKTPPRSSSLPRSRRSSS
jgi:hypothetical protein